MGKMDNKPETERQLLGLKSFIYKKNSALCMDFLSEKKLTADRR
jgi:hypothetical protein